MSIRFNAVWRGKRTTVRVPSFLCRLHSLVTGFDNDQQLVEDLRAHLRIVEERGEDKGLTASQSCVAYMEWNVEDSLTGQQMPPSRSKASNTSQTIL